MTKVLAQAGLEIEYAKHLWEGIASAEEGGGMVLSQSCFFESLGVCKSLNF